MPVTDLMLADAYGWVAFEDAIGGDDGITMIDNMGSYSTCQTAPIVYPGSSSVSSSESNFENYAMLAFYAGDPNSYDRCAFSGVHSDSTMMAVSGAGECNLCMIPSPESYDH